MTKLYARTLEPSGDTEAKLTVLLIHGLGSNEDDLLGFAQPLGLPLRYVSARGHIPMPHGFAPGFAWYEFAAGGHPVRQGFEQGLDGLIQLVRDVKAAHDVPSSKLLVAGFSQGAVMTMATALSIPDEIGGIVAMSGYFPAPEGWQPPHEDLRGLPALFTHGTADPIVPVQGSRDASVKFQQLGADVQYEEFHDMAHEVSPECLLTIRNWLKARVD